MKENKRGCFSEHSVVSLRVAGGVTVEAVVVVELTVVAAGVARTVNDANTIASYRMQTCENSYKPKALFKHTFRKAPLTTDE